MTQSYSAAAGWGLRIEMDPKYLTQLIGADFKNIIVDTEARMERAQ